MAHIPLQLEGCIGGCNREIRSLIEERNKAHLYPRIFFPRGPPRVTIHANGGGGDVDDGDRRHQGRTQVDSHQPGRQALGQISHGSQRVNGRDEDMEDIVVHMKKNETQGDFQQDQMGYKFPNDKFYRIMSTLDSGCDSVKELVAKMTMCSFIINSRGEHALVKFLSHEWSAPKVFCRNFYLADFGNPRPLCILE